MSSSTNQLSQVMALRRSNKRPRVDPELVEAERATARMRRDCEDTLTALARFKEDWVKVVCADLYDDIESLMQEDEGVVAEADFDDGGPSRDFDPVYGYPMVHDQDRRRCPCCNKFLAPDGTVQQQTKSYELSTGTIDDPIDLSMESVSNRDLTELADDGASAMQ